jgi:hypothetical protein
MKILPGGSVGEALMRTIRRRADLKRKAEAPPPSFRDLFLRAYYGAAQQRPLISGLVDRLSAAGTTPCSASTGAVSSRRGGGDGKKGSDK